MTPLPVIFIRVLNYKILMVVNTQDLIKKHAICHHHFKGYKRVDRKGCVPTSLTLGTIIKKSYNDSSILSTSLGSKTLNTSSLGLWGIKIKDTVVGAIWPGFHPPPPSRCLQAWHTCTFPGPQFPIMAKLVIKSFARTPGASGLISM